MLNKIGATLLVIFAFGSMVGCAHDRATASLTPGTDISKAKSFYVVKDSEDGRRLDELIKSNLVKRGYQATNGPAMKLPYKSDAVLTYVDKWFWDITMVMSELTITLRNPNSGFPMAVGNFLQTSLNRKSPEEVIDVVLTSIFSETNNKHSDVRGREEVKSNANRLEPTAYEGMVPPVVETVKKHSQTVNITVTGGKEPDPEIFDRSEISDASLAQALVETITKSQIFSRVAQGSGSDYHLAVHIFSMEQPKAGLSFTVSMEIGWTLKRTGTDTIVWQESIKSQHTVTVGEAFVGDTRRRLAAEGAVRNNIAQGLSKISKLNL